MQNNLPVASMARDLYQLGKPRITLFVCITAVAGFYLASTNGVHLEALLYTFIGTYLVSYSSCVFNQIIEVDSDQLMGRTQNRPLPTKRISMKLARMIGFATVTFGLALLAYKVGVSATMWLGLGWVGYVMIYTPLKKRTTLNTIVGAFVGALPPVVGWVAARGRVSFEALVLFLIMFFWQLPHFLSIAWMYKQDYMQADFQMLSGIDVDGELTPRQAFLYTIMLFPVVLLPFAFSLAGGVYLLGSVALTILLTRSVWLFWRDTDAVQAKKVLLASVFYLPALFLLLVMDKVN